MHAKRKHQKPKPRVLIIGRRRRAVIAGPPSAPLNLAIEQTPTYLHLTWDDASSDEEGFRLYRQAFDGPFEVVAELIASQSEFYDGNVEMGIVYTYYVVAWNASGQSQPSNEVSGEIILGS